jgi:two-component system sensor histidine kinase KdpD
MPSEPMLARFDFSLVQHAFENLLANAATHTPPGTAIEVGVAASDGRIVLSVGDRGPGIEAESMARIFDKFYRGPKALAGGSGLGLTIAKGFLEAQGGTVTVANRPGGGALFSLCLPVILAPSPEGAIQ